MTIRPGPEVLTFALEDWPRKDGPSTRASKPKVRTGCITCKRRRVKCDEAKPTCHNCVKRKVPCEGYITESRASKTPPKQAVRSPRGAVVAISPRVVEPSYEGLVFTSQLQRDHFDHWLWFAGDTLVFPSELITETIPQLARSDAGVRNAAFAIGAASLGSSTREQRLRGKGPYYPDALKYYNRALQHTAAMKRYAVDEMPEVFDTLDEAHRWWEITQHHIVHHAPLLIGFRVEGTGNKSPAAYPSTQSLPISTEKVKEHMKFIERWRARFLPLVEATGKHAKDQEDRERLKTLGLRIHSTYLSVPTKTANYTDWEALVSLTPAFREVVTLSEKFLTIQQRHAKMGEVFTMNSISPTWPLGAAAILCADDNVKADAMRLLRRFPRRDGLWDTCTYVTMLEGVQRAKETLRSRVGEESEGDHMFSYEVVYDEKSISWVKAVEDPAIVGRDGLEYKIEMP
ncbi:Aspercryptin biosynthesis cluster-specific transcription regulator atnN [Colletotrichum sp. SAR11_59]|nr:Aspercryptin biosynthesis cluster-specific transcription regulator atnN [Colletotrichum sp. SAR11_59]